MEPERLVFAGAVKGETDFREKLGYLKALVQMPSTSRMLAGPLAPEYPGKVVVIRSASRCALRCQLASISPDYRGRIEKALSVMTLPEDFTLMITESENGSTMVEGANRFCRQFGWDYRSVQ